MQCDIVSRRRAPPGLVPEDPLRWGGSLGRRHLGGPVNVRNRLPFGHTTLLLYLCQLQCTQPIL